MNFKQILHSDVGKVIISVVLGVGFSCLFKKVCKDKDCLIFKGPVIQTVDGKIFQHDDKCYTYKLKSVSCDKKKKTIEF